jgi:hypothetical protein
MIEGRTTPLDVALNARYSDSEAIAAFGMPLAQLRGPGEMGDDRGK